jgi:two-component system cell cycle sensor histidine kinase/response regulator CckA
MPENLSLLLIENRGGIARALLSSQPGFTVVHADRLSKASALCAQAEPGAFQVILVDLSLPESKGIESFRRASALLPGAPLVALNQGQDPDLAETAIAEGAQACLNKDGLDGGSLAQALRQAVLRHRAEARRYRALFDSAPIGILLAAGRRVAMANPAGLEIVGRSEAELSQSSILDLFPEGVRPLLEKALDAVDGEIPQARFSVDLDRPNAPSLRCQVFVTGAMLNNAPAVALYLAAQEAGVGERPRDAGMDEAFPAEHLRQSRKMDALGRLAGGVAHDFNNLLTAINGYSEHLLTLPGVEGALASGLKAIRRAGDTAAAMTRSLMSFGHTEGGESRSVRVDAAIADMAPVLKRLVGDAIEFRIDLEADDASVRLDPGQMEQLVLNLCVNARDAMPDGGVLTLTTAVEDVAADDGASFSHLAPALGGHIVITVQDNGIGMGPETLECLFEPFYSTKRGGRGSGLGLATVYGIVSHAGGGISVASVPGQGSRFRIYLACEQVAEGNGGPVASAPTAEKGWKPQPNRETILVVEDEPSLREMILAILERYGFALLEAASAGEAMEIVAENAEAVDLVVTDVMLRGDSGYELAESLQEIKPGLRTVFISGHSLESLADRDIIIPADAFLEKPFSPAQLAAKVRSVLDAARKAG